MNTYLRFSVVMSSLNLLPVCPWFVPAAPASLRLGVEALRSEIELYAPRQIVQREEEPYSEIRVVHSGLLSQAVINRRLSKPLAMNLYAESSMIFKSFHWSAGSAACDV